MSLNIIKRYNVAEMVAKGNNTRLEVLNMLSRMRERAEIDNVGITRILNGKELIEQVVWEYK